MRKLARRMMGAGIGLLSLGLVACSSGGVSDQKQTAENGKSEKPELVFWELPYGPADTYGPALQKILDKYNSEDHSATVRLQMLSWSGFMEQYQTSIAAGSPPDITSSISYRIANWAEAGEVLDLSSVVEKWKQEDDEILKDFLPGTLDIGKKNGKYYAFPYVTNATTIYYRTDILEDELGFTDLDKPVSWEKLFEMCEAVKNKYNGDVIPFSFCTLDQNSSNAMINVFFSNGTSWVNEEGNKGAFDDPKALESMGFFKTMMENGYFPEGMVTYNQADLEKLYQSGKVAMVWNAPASHVTSDKELMGKTKMMGPVYGPSADEPRYVMRTGGIMGFAQTKHPEETKEFLEWFVKNNMGIYMSFTNKSLMRSDQTNFIYLENYIRLYQDKEFLGSLAFTFVYTTLVVFISYIAGLVLALALNREMKGRAIFRTIFLLPWVIPSVVAMTNWSWLLNDQFGFINAFLKKLHIIEKPILFLADYKYIRMTVILISVWKAMPFIMVSLLAGLQSVPKELYEAAGMDGAGFMAKLKNITLPLIWPVSFISVTLNFIWTINNFENIWLLTGGGPNGHTFTLPIYSYYTAFYRQKLSYAAAIATMLIICMLLVGGVYFMIKQKSRDMEGGLKS